ncbi:MAG TPA: flagellar basal body rod protein FlgB [Halieaceae bacterium]|nr:flagellar basal body rod protein FlgB [Halieaceae bacterium]
MAFADRVMGVSPQALHLRAQRLELIAGNLANADTPGYKARDIDFRQAMAAAGGAPGSGELRRTHARHLTAAGLASGGNAAADVRFRLPSQPSMDGNTVETQREQAAFMDNAVRYQASLTLLDGRIKSAISALRGGQR